MSTSPKAAELHVLADADVLVATVAAAAIADLARAQADRGRVGSAALVLTGGGILEQLMAGIAQHTDRDAVAWDRVDVYWGDERFVPADSPDRNDGPADTLLLSVLPFAPQRIHRMPASDGQYGSDVQAAADGYAQVLSAAGPPTFDLVLLGMGPDGHCCSLFPHEPGPTILDRSVIAVPNSPKPPPIRLSLTFAALAAAAQVWVVASGSAKADAVASGLAPGADPRLVPVAGARGRDRTRWYVDAAAASRLDRTG